jgi:hypothetical protein
MTKWLIRSEFRCPLAYNNASSRSSLACYGHAKFAHAATISPKSISSLRPTLLIASESPAVTVLMKISDDVLPSGHTSRRWGIRIKHQDGTVGIEPMPCLASTRSIDRFVGTIKPMLYFTNASLTVRVCYQQLPCGIGVKDLPGSQTVIGSASEVGQSQDGQAVWSLRVHDADVPGHWVIVDGMFMAATDEPALD